MRTEIVQKTELAEKHGNTGSGLFKGIKMGTTWATSWGFMNIFVGYLDNGKTIEFDVSNDAHDIQRFYFDLQVSHLS